MNASHTLRDLPEHHESHPTVWKPIYHS